MPTSETGNPQERLGSWDQFMASFGAAARQDCPTIVGSHAGPESMGAIAADLAGLIGSFHGWESFFLDFCIERTIHYAILCGSGQVSRMDCFND